MPMLDLLNMPCKDLVPIPAACRILAMSKVLKSTPLKIAGGRGTLKSFVELIKWRPSKAKPKPLNPSRNPQLNPKNP